MINNTTLKIIFPQEPGAALKGQISLYNFCGLLVCLGGSTGKFTQVALQGQSQGPGWHIFSQLT
jgi:hypothetical protein